MALSKAEGLRCAASFVVASYFYCTPHSSGFAWIFFLCRLIPTFYEIIKGDFWEKRL